MCDSSNDFRSSSVGSRTTSSPRILYCINIDRAANPMSVVDTRNPILVFWSELYNISTRPCQHLRLYSVVVSTLVFETDILSISEYREPGFEPQYDLSFCSVDGNGVMLFGYQPWHVGRGERQMCPVGDGLLRSIGCVRTWITSVKLTALPNRCSGRHGGGSLACYQNSCSFVPP